MDFGKIEADIGHTVKGIYSSPDVVHYPYHNLAHTMGVVAHVKEMAVHYSLRETDGFILTMAAWFHDIGHLYGDMAGHEERGVKIMMDYLQAIPADLVVTIGKCILATKLPGHPTNLLEEIICDADTYHLGTPFFRETDGLVEKEMMLRTGKTFPGWHRGSLMLLERHQFFTAYCRELLEKGKKENIAWLIELIRKEAGSEERTSLRELAGLFTKLGLTAFGGPAAHIAMMQKEVVDKRQWMDHQHFLDLIGATNLIPGPNSTEMAIHIGHERGGWKGLLVAGCCFILPAVLITGVIAWLYRQYGQLPQVRPFIYGIKPAIIAIILAAVFPLAKKALKTVELWVIGALTLVASLAGVNEIFVMFGAGLVILLLYMVRLRRTVLPLVFLEIPLFSEANMRIFLVFLKIGAILYGSGYVLFAFLDSELVARGLLSRTQLVDAIAVGQFTPGPVFSSVTFIGWQMNGLYGAVMATVAVFLPSFVFVALLNPLVPRMRRSKLFSAFLDGVNAASVAIIVTVCIAFARETVTDWRTVLIAVLSLGVTFGFRKVNKVFVVAGSALAGYLLLLV